MSFEEITKDIVIAMIDRGSIPFEGSFGNEKPTIDLATANAKAVAAAYKIVYAQVATACKKQRQLLTEHLFNKPGALTA